VQDALLGAIFEEIKLKKKNSLFLWGAKTLLYTLKGMGSGIILYYLSHTYKGVGTSTIERFKNK